MIEKIVEFQRTHFNEDQLNLDLMAILKEENLYDDDSYENNSVSSGGNTIYSTPIDN